MTLAEAYRSIFHLPLSEATHSEHLHGPFQSRPVATLNGVTVVRLLLAGHQPRSPAMYCSVRFRNKSNSTHDAMDSGTYNIAGRRSSESTDGELLHVFTHVDPNHVSLRIIVGLGKSFTKFGLACDVSPSKALVYGGRSCGIKRSSSLNHSC
jgi:hypothetical protein